MTTTYRPPSPGHYRLTRGVRITIQEKGGIAICAYPLRSVRVSASVTRLLQQCTTEYTCEELATILHLPPQRVQTLCEQLHWKGWLEAGPPLPPVPPAAWPSVSIIIPTHNRARQLERCLRSLCTLDYPTNHLEIVIVDDASTDETRTMLHRFMQEGIAQHRTIRVVLHVSQQGVALSRNAGAEAARYPLLAYIDSDCVASPEWLRELVPAFQDTRVAAVGGMIRAYERQSMLGRYEDVRSSLFMGKRPQQVRLEGPLTYLPTANFLVRRTEWQRLNGFAPLTFGEDVDFCRRLLTPTTPTTPTTLTTPTAQLLYLPQGIVYHDYRTQLRAFLQIRASYASAEAALLQRHPEERRVLLLPPEQAAFAGLAIGGLWRGLWSFGSCVGTGGRAWWRRGPCACPGGGSICLPGQAHGTHQGPHSTSSPPPVPMHIYAPLSKKPTHASSAMSILMLTVALLLTIWGASRRYRKVRQQRIPIGPFAVWRATIQGHLAYTYHLARHLTRYYTLPLLLIGILLPPLLILVSLLLGIVIGVDYVRLRPEMKLSEYALCSILDDCAYEVGVVRGCLQHGTWKPLWPVITTRLRSKDQD